MAFSSPEPRIKLKKKTKQTTYILETWGGLLRPNRWCLSMQTPRMGEAGKFTRPPEAYIVRPMLNLGIIDLNLHYFSWHCLILHGYFKELPLQSKWHFFFSLINPLSLHSSFLTSPSSFLSKRWGFCKAVQGLRRNTDAIWNGFLIIGQQKLIHVILQ